MIYIWCHEYIYSYHEYAYQYHEYISGLVDASMTGSTSGIHAYETTKIHLSDRAKEIKVPCIYICHIIHKYPRDTCTKDHSGYHLDGCMSDSFLELHETSMIRDSEDTDNFTSDRIDIVCMDSWLESHIDRIIPYQDRKDYHHTQQRCIISLPHIHSHDSTTGHRRMRRWKPSWWKYSRYAYFSGLIKIYRYLECLRTSCDKEWNESIEEGNGH
jgi:hypothetical protein